MHGGMVGTHMKTNKQLQNFKCLLYTKCCNDNNNAYSKNEVNECLWHKFIVFFSSLYLQKCIYIKRKVEKVVFF